MRYSKVLVNAVLGFLLPCCIVYPHAPVFALTTQVNERFNENSSIKPQNDCLFSYDQLLKLIDDLEEGKLEQRYSLEELERINYLFAHLAKQGIFSDDDYELSILENDIEELLSPHDLGYSFDYRRDFEIIPVVFDRQREVILCKSWVSKQWKQTKNFVSEHKREIIIGSAIVVAAGVIIICAVPATAVAGVAAVAGTVSSSGTYKEDYSAKDSKSSSDISSSFDAEATSILVNPTSDNNPNLKGIFQDHFASFTEQVIEKNTLVNSDLAKIKNELSFREHVRGFGSYLAHETFEEIAELVSFVPQLNEEIKQIGNKFMPDSLMPDISSSDNKNYENIVTAGHKKIDEIFATNQSERYTSEAKLNNHESNLTLGMIPPPGAFSSSIKDFNKLSNTGNAVDIGEVVVSARKTLAVGEDLALTTKEIAALKQSGEVEQVIGKGRDFFAGNPKLQASFDLFEKAEKFLQHKKEFMSEDKVRSLIHQVGINTYPRPIDIPKNFRVKIAKDGAGIKYVHPSNEQTYIRVMPGKPHSHYPAQQRPYVTWMKNGETLDKNGNVVNKRSIEAHIPIEDFKYVQ